jgi:hypothetical protein
VCTCEATFPFCARGGQNDVPSLGDIFLQDIIPLPVSGMDVGLAQSKQDQRLLQGMVSCTALGCNKVQYLET